MKCHRCRQLIQTEWVRGQLLFCSEQCRTESKNEGEPCTGWVYLGVGDEMVYIGEVPGKP